MSLPDHIIECFKKAMDTLGPAKPTASDAAITLTGATSGQNIFIDCVSENERRSMAAQQQAFDSRLSLLVLRQQQAFMLDHQVLSSAPYGTIRFPETNEDDGESLTLHYNREGTAMVFKFGKHQGKNLTDSAVPTDYIQFMLDLRKKDALVFQAELDRREALEEASASWAEIVIKAGMQTLAKKHACLDDTDWTREQIAAWVAQMEVKYDLL